MNDFASTPELILLPAVDVADGKAVRLTQGEAGTETNYGDPVDAAVERGVACYAAAMTPTEVRRVLDGRATGALLWPADVVGHAIGARFAEIGLAERVIPLGGIGAYAAGEWLKSGSPAVCIDTTLIGDAFTGGSLVQLRDRCGSFVTVRDKHAAG